MRKWFQKTRDALAGAVFAAAFCGIIGGAVAQVAANFLLINPVLQGHFINGGSGTAAVPVGTGCTILAASSDTDGSCTASAASGSIAFAQSYTVAPICSVVDASATSTVSMPVYSVTTTGITLTTIISTHVLYWHCAARIGSA